MQLAPLQAYDMIHIKRYELMTKIINEKISPHESIQYHYHPIKILLEFLRD